MEEQVSMSEIGLKRHYEEHMKRKLIHDIKNKLQIVLWGLEDDAQAEDKADGRKAVREIIKMMEADNGSTTT